MDLDEFIASPFRNQWIKERGLDYYVRKSILYPGVIELANCEAREDSKLFGLWRFFKKYEAKVPFIAEQVINEDLADYLRCKKWRERQLGGIPQFASPLTIERFKDDERFLMQYPS